MRLWNRWKMNTLVLQFYGCFALQAFEPVTTLKTMNRRVVRSQIPKLTEGKICIELPLKFVSVKNCGWERVWGSQQRWMCWHKLLLSTLNTWTKLGNGRSWGGLAAFIDRRCVRRVWTNLWGPDLTDLRRVRSPKPWLNKQNFSISDTFWLFSWQKGGFYFSTKQWFSHE